MFNRKGTQQDPSHHVEQFNKGLLTAMKLVTNFLPEGERKEMEKQYSLTKIATGQLPFVMVEYIHKRKIFNNYHEQIIGRNESFFLDHNYAAALGDGGMKSEKKIDSWVVFIESIKGAWKRMSEAQRDQMWESVGNIYMSYLEYEAIMDAKRK